MNLEEVQNEIEGLKAELQKVPAIQERLHRLLGMEEILIELEKQEQKPDLKVANQK